jgi:hypothetical protein
VDVASPEEGFRVHFHRYSDPRPVEIDAANFEFGFTVTGSTRLEIDAWVEALAPDVPCDDGFRLLPPGGEGESVVLDNAAQFLFYSAWRAALQRRRAG